MAQGPLAGGPLTTAPASAASATAPNGPAGSGTNGAQAAIQSSLAALANLTLRQIVLATMTVLAVTLAFLLLYRFYAVVFLLFVAIAIQIALDPLVRFLAARGINRIVAMFAIYILLFAAIGSVIWFGAAPLADQVRNVAGTLPNYYHHMRESLLQAPVGFVRGLASVLPAEPSASLVMAAVNQGGGEAAAAAAASTTDAVQVSSDGTSPTQAWQWVITASQAFFGLFAVFAIAFYWSLEGDVIVRRLILKAPSARRDELRALVTESQGKIAAFFRGQLILCSIIGLASTIAYLLLGIPNAFLLGLLMALFESVPLVGPFLGAVPALLVTMSSAPDKLVWVIGALVLIQVLESNLLVPRVMDRSVGVNAIITMLALAAFGALFGLLGALLAVPLAAILQIVVGRILFNAPINEETTPAAPVGADVSRSRIGVLRLEAQNLVHAVRKQARSAEEKGEAIEDPAEQTEDDIEAIAAELDSLLSTAEAKENGENRAERTGEQAGDLVIESAPARGSTGGGGATARRLP
jgi:predicted PurR-regulated permease PerM